MVDKRREQNGVKTAMHTHPRPETGMVGLFWVVEEAGSPAVIALAVPWAQAEVYGDMLTIDAGHLEYWTQLAKRGASALRAAGLPTAPVWSEYDEWPRGRVLYDREARQFVIRADRRLHRPAFLSLLGGLIRDKDGRHGRLPR